MITFNDSHKVSESNPIPIGETILVKYETDLKDIGSALCTIEETEKDMMFPKNRNMSPVGLWVGTHEWDFDIEDITHFQIIKEQEQ